MIEINKSKNKTKFRICFMVESFYPMIGGCETHGRQLVEGFVEKGAEAFVLTRRVLPELKKNESLGNIHVYRIAPVGESHSIRRWIMIFPCFLTLIKMQGRYDIIFVYGIRTLGIPAVIASKLLGKKCILRPANSGEMNGKVFIDGLKKFKLSLSSGFIRYFLKFRNWLFSKADLFINISSEIKTELINNGVNPDKIKYIPNGVDTTRFYPLNECEKIETRKKLDIPLEKTVAIFVGRLVYWKGLPILVKVWKEIVSKHPNTLLLIVGPGVRGLDSCEDEVKAFVHDNNLMHNVRFTSGVNNVQEYLQASDIFILPSVNEGFSNSLVEAMASGLPVIAYYKDAAIDVIQNWKNGVTVSVGSFSDLYEAIDSLINNKALAISIGKAAFETVRENYSKEKIIDVYIGLFIQMQKSLLKTTHS